MNATTQISEVTFPPYTLTGGVAYRGMDPKEPVIEDDEFQLDDGRWDRSYNWTSAGKGRQAEGHRYRRRLEADPATYALLQSAWLSHFNVGVGSRVRVVRGWKPDELGFPWYFVPPIHEMIGREFSVSSAEATGISLAGFRFPFHVLAPVEEQPKVNPALPRFFVDERGGCIAVRDRTLTDPEYPGLHYDTEGVVWYRHGTYEKGWSVDPKHVEEAKVECARLNDEHNHPPAVPEGQGECCCVEMPPGDYSADDFAANCKPPTPAIERGLPKYPSDLPDPNLYCHDCDYWGPERRCPKCNDPMVEGPVEEEAIERGEEPATVLIGEYTFEQNDHEYPESVWAVFNGDLEPIDPPKITDIASSLWSVVEQAYHVPRTDTWTRDKFTVINAIAALLPGYPCIPGIAVVPPKPTPTPSAGQEEDPVQITIEDERKHTAGMVQLLVKLASADPPTSYVIDDAYSPAAKEITRLRGEVAKWNLVMRAATEDNFSEFVPPDVHRVIDRIGAKMTKQLMREAVEHTQRIVDLTTRAETAEADLGRAREALGFYANERNWRSANQVNYQELFETAMGDDLGKIARQFLRPAAKDDEGGGE